MERVRFAVESGSRAAWSKVAAPAAALWVARADQALRRGRHAQPDVAMAPPAVRPAPATACYSLPLQGRHARRAGAADRLARRERREGRFAPVRLALATACHSGQSLPLQGRHVRRAMVEAAERLAGRGRREG